MKPAILVSAPLPPKLPAEVREGLRPRPDFLALAEALDATLITPPSASGGFGPVPAKAARIFRAAWTAFQRRHEYDLIITDIERVGLALALLFKLARARNRQVVICHGKIILRQDLALLRALGLRSHIHRFVCYGPLVAQVLQDTLRLPEGRVVTVRHGPDQRFWRPLPVTPEPLIVSAGMLRRDYPTLINAVRGLQVSLVIAAFSPWVNGAGNGVHGGKLPPNVHVTRCSPEDLRRLYGRALFVAVPLQGSRSPAGSLVVYEAMAMGKPVVITRTQGQDSLNVVEEGATGHYMAPGDVEGWRATTARLLSEPEAALRMGTRARATVEQGLNLDAYVQSMVEVVQSTWTEKHGTAVARAPNEAT